MNNMNKLSLLIPTYNNVSGLNYLLNYFKDKPYKIIAVDNGKITQNSKLKTQIQNLKLKTNKFIFLPQEKNLGFAKAVNLGAKYVETEWMGILNDDIEFKIQNAKCKNQNDNLKFKIKKTKKEIFDYLISYAEKNGFEAVSPILVNPDGEIENVGYKILSYGKIKLIKELASWRVDELNNKIQNSKIKKQNDNEKCKIKIEKFIEIDGITAACLLIKTNVFKQLGGFDESFFAYLEDVEFFIRFKKAGGKFGIAPVSVLHHHMTTSKTMGSFKARQDMVNWWRLYFKHPDKFKFNLNFIVERLRNISGYIKAIFNY